MTAGPPDVYGALSKIESPSRAMWGMAQHPVNGGAILRPVGTVDGSRDLGACARAPTPVLSMAPAWRPAAKSSLEDGADGLQCRAMSKSATSPQRAALGGRLGILAAAALFSTGGAAVKSASLSGWQVACFRAGIAAVALYLMLPAARRRPSRWTLLVAVGHAITMILFVLSNKLTTAASSIFLQSTAPLYVLLLGPWLLHERVKRRDLYFIGLVAVGLSLMFIGLDPASATAPRPFLGNVLALAAGLFWGLTVMGLRSLSRTGDGGVESGSPAAATLWANAFACLACLPFALPLASNGIGAVDLAVVSFLGIFQ